jgi:hypothetical protein
VFVCRNQWRGSAAGGGRAATWFLTEMIQGIMWWMACRTEVVPPRRPSTPVASGWLDTCEHAARLGGSHWTRPPETVCADHAGPGHLLCLSARRRAESTNADLRVVSCSQLSERTMPVPVLSYRPPWPLWRSYSSWIIGIKAVPETSSGMATTMTASAPTVLHSCYSMSFISGTN